MQLKKVQLSGFKSFANKTELMIPNGVTTIVGPNGSGKSNISDAVRWVLGEQSAKSLRGGKMEDVIFAGTQNRKMVGYAEVILTIDNASKKLPVEFAEVEVTRRLYRSGESQYFINQTSCRLKDIQELFMDTGVGKDGYSIISQGKIEEVLSNKSEERRGIFEEAAGIVKYKTRKTEAEKRLGNAEENILRVTDILNEISGKIEPLAEQAKVARRYLEVKEKLKYVDVCVFLDKVEYIGNKISEYENLLNSAKNSVELEEKKIEISELQKEEIKEKIRINATKIELVQEEFYALKTEFADTKSKVESDLGKIDSNIEKIEEYKEEIRENLEKIDEAEKNIENRNTKITNLEESKIKFQNEIDEKLLEYQKLSKNMDESQSNVENLKQDIINLNEENVEKHTKIKSFENENISSEKRIITLNSYINNKISEQDSLTLEIEEHKNNVNEINKEYKKIEEAINKAREIKDEKNSKIQELLKEKNNLENDIQKYTHERELLISMENQNEGYARSVKSVLDFSKDNKNVYGTVASIFQTEEKYEVAMESILGGLMQNIVVEDENSAKRCIEYLKENKLGKATFFPLNTIRVNRKDINKKARNQLGFIGAALDLVSYDKKFNKVMELVFSNVVVVDNIDNAIKIAKNIEYSSKVVTLDGEIISQVGSMSGGSTQVKTSGIVGRTKKIENLKEKLENLTEKLKDLSEILKTQNEMLEYAKNEYNTLNESFVEIKMERASLDQKTENYKTKEQNLKESRDNIQKEKENLEIKIESNRNEIITLKDQIESNNKIKEEKQYSVDEYVRFNKEKSDKMDILNEDITNLKISLSSFDESKMSLDEMIEVYQNSISELQDKIAKKNEDIEKIKLENKSILEAKENLSVISSDYDSKILEKEEELSNLKGLRSSLDKDLEDLDLQYKDAYKNMSLMQEEKTRLESQIEKITSEIESIKTRMWDEYEITTSKAREILKTSEEQILLVKSENKDLKKYAQTLKTEIKSMGMVNVSAIEEYTQVKERYEFLTTQKEDLELTKTKLLELIDNMTSIMKKQFKSQFQIINENFNEVFKHLFGGGKANLILQDENNILECGIDIEAEPPGKKLQNMSLLSGGERALTAIALLFAILKMKAPPFCILDEIEAALDDVNVQRFAKYIKKYSDKTQFIVITHRKGTMEVAKTVYGVTMQEYGVSNVVSMKMK